jgi:hypothetical protein
LQTGISLSCEIRLGRNQLTHFCMYFEVCIGKCEKIVFYFSVVSSAVVVCYIIDYKNNNRSEKILRFNLCE